MKTIQHSPIIVLVEDDQDNAEMTSLVLNEAGYRTVVFQHISNIDQLLALLPDLIILDLNLGDISGHKICQVLKANGRSKHLPVLIISGSPDIHVISGECGADAYVAKPYDIGDLQDIVEKLIVRPRTVN